MSIVWYVLWFIVALGVLVTVHEFGHFWVARRLGFKVLRFSVGFGKPLLKYVAGADRTEYVIAAIPLGGYVKMLDEREGPVPPQELHRSFTRRPPWQRILVLLAGPGFNFAFAILVLWGMFWVSGTTFVKPVVGEVAQHSPAARAGLQSGDEILAIDGREVKDRQDAVLGLLDSVTGTGQAELTVRSREGRERNTTFVVGDSQERRRLTESSLLFKGLGFEFWEPAIPPVLAQVVPDGPAGRAGLQVGDEILAIDGVPVDDFRDIATHISAHPGETLKLRYRRDGAERTTQVTVASEEVGGQKVGRIQVARPANITYPQSMIIHTDLSPIAALGRASVETWDMTVLQARLVWRMLLGNVSLKSISGPLSIAQFAGDSAEAGVAPFLEFLVLISLGLGFLNLLPIPLLDGGQIVFQLIEWVKGRPLSERVQLLGQQIGIGILVMLMGLAFYNDITARLFNN